MVLLLIRPADWVPAMLNWPLEMVVMTVALLSVIVKRLTTPVEDRKRIPLLKWLIFWVIIIALSNLANGKPEEALDHGFRYFKCAVAVLIICWAVDTNRKLRML